MLPNLPLTAVFALQVTEGSSLGQHASSLYFPLRLRVAVVSVTGPRVVNVISRVTMIGIRGLRHLWMTD